MGGKATDPNSTFRGHFRIGSVPLLLKSNISEMLGYLEEGDLISLLLGSMGVEQ